MTEALRFLRSLEEQSRWDHKYIVLDCSADMAKEIVVTHVRDITLGKRTYHYLLSGLVSFCVCVCVCACWGFSFIGFPFVRELKG